MLNVNTLEKQIKQAFDEVFPPALERAMLEMLPTKSDLGDKRAKQFGQTITDLISGDIAKRLAAAIDYYVKNADVYGTVITMGGPFTQTAILDTPSPITGGKIPNQLGIR